MISATPPEVIFHNGKVLTVDLRFTIADAVAVSGDRIAATGDDAEIKPLAGDGTRVIDLKGRTLIPGLIDGHAHMDREGLKQVCPSLSGARSIADVQARIAELARAARPGDWIVTMPLGDPPNYWDDPHPLKEGRSPDRWELDEAGPDNPVYIRPVWGYWRRAPRAETLISAANSAALAATGIGRDTSPPTDGVTIGKDPATGDLTGVFMERGPTSVVELTMFAAMPRFTAEQRVDGLERAMRLYNAAGTTAVYEGHGIAPELLNAYRTLHLRGGMTVRSHLAFSPSWGVVPREDRLRHFRQWAAWLGLGGLGDPWLRMEGMWTQVGENPDDVVRAQAAPYTSWSGFHYDSGLERDDLVGVLVEAARLGVRVAGLTPSMIDVFEAVDRQAPIAALRWVLVHPVSLTQADIDRVLNLGLVLTPETGRYLYKEGNAPGNPFGNVADDTHMPLKSLVDAGVPVALETDNVPPTLFHVIWQTVARIDRLGHPVGSADQKLSREEALRLATNGGAYLIGREGELGSLEPGKLADLAVLSDDYLGCPEDRIKEITADLVMVGGRIVRDISTGDR